MTFCDACAETCHDGHDLVFIGMIDSYCDCHGNKRNECLIGEISRRKGNALRGCCGGGDCSPMLAKLVDNDQISTIALDKTRESTRLNSFRSFTLKSPSPSSSSKLNLKHYCKELVKVTKETHWLSADRCLEPLSSLHPLERTAAQIYNFHCPANTTSVDGRNPNGGCEWWIQVKSFGDEIKNKDEAIDMHYDKDERIAAEFGLAAFPKLSTVTYLTKHTDKTSCLASPTLFFDHIYIDDEEKPIKSCRISYPRKDKHVVFDGRCLHGAPANKELKVAYKGIDDSANNNDEEVEEEENDDVRITFLVNIWEYKPCIEELDKAVLDGLPLPLASTSIAGAISSENSEDEDKFTFEPTNVSVIDVNEVDESQPVLTLHFDSTGSTWDDDEDEEEVGDDTKAGKKGEVDVEEGEEAISGLVVQIPQLPELRNNDVFAINYVGDSKKGCCARLVNLVGDDEEEEEEGDNEGEEEEEEEVDWETKIANSMLARG